MLLCYLTERETKHCLISYFLSSTSATNYHTRVVYVRIIASQRWDFFETQCTFILSLILTSVGASVHFVAVNYCYTTLSVFVPLKLTAWTTSAAKHILFAVVYDMSQRLKHF